MHEMHLLRDLMDDLLKKAEENDVDKITRIYIRMGDYTEINPEILRYFFREHGKETIAEGAEIEIEPSQTRELRLLSFDCE